MAEVPKTKTRIALNNIYWGALLWLFGYMLGFVFYALVPKAMIGWYVMPSGVLATWWVLIKKIKHAQLMCYLGVGVFWTVIAVVLDYIFLVKLLGANDYYKTDIFIYYGATFLLPLAAGWYKKMRGEFKV